MKNTISISPNKLSQILLVVTVFLTLASATSSFLGQVSIDNALLVEMRESFMRLFDPNGEANIIAWYSACTLLLCSFLSGIIALVKKKNHGDYTRHWEILSLIFLYMSVDEAAVIHEMAVKPLRDLFDLGGFFYYGWIIPAGIAVLIFGLAYLKFLLHLPSRTRSLFLIAGGIFVGGAIGIESISGLLDHLYSQGRIASDEMVIIIETIEEFMEMLGIVICVYTLLDYISSHLKEVSFHVGNQQPADSLTTHSKEPIAGIGA